MYQTWLSAFRSCQVERGLGCAAWTCVGSMVGGRLELSGGLGLAPQDLSTLPSQVESRGRDLEGLCPLLPSSSSSHSPFPVSCLSVSFQPVVAFDLCRIPVCPRVPLCPVALESRWVVDPRGSPSVTPATLHKEQLLHASYLS